MTYDLTHLRALDERLRAATGADHSLDHDLALSLLGKPKGLLADYQTYIWAIDGKIVSSKELRLTASTNAAKALTYKLFPGWKLLSGHSFHTPDFVALLCPPTATDPSSSLCVSEVAPTEPLAILRSLVSALIAQAEATPNPPPTERISIVPVMPIGTICKTCGTNHPEGVCYGLFGKPKESAQ